MSEPMPEVGGALPRELLTGLVDYAGLFPPAALSMPEAVAQYASYRSGARSWMLGRFVLSVNALDDFAAAASTARRTDDPWRLAVLAMPADAERVRRFNAEHAGGFVIDTVESRVTTDAEATALVAAYGSEFSVFAEIPLDATIDDRIAALSVLGLSAKIRTGGVTAEAFPATARVAEFLRACVRHRIPFKATAGLHHPLRGDYRLTYAADSASGRMFGFLNVFLAAMFMAHGMSDAEAIALLEEEDPAAFEVTADRVRWRHHSLRGEQIAAARAQWVRSFGSCSFAEPVADLEQLRLL